MVHGDEDPWRKKCESYGFILAKGSVIMDAEILRERMKPENIKNNVGQDQWDYGNDRVIGTGRGWNYNAFGNQIHQPAYQANTQYSPEIDDSLARDTFGQRDTSLRIPEENASASLTEANVVNYAEYRADRAVLLKELALGKELLDKAIANITSEYLSNLSNHDDASVNEINCSNVFLKLVGHLNGTDNSEENKTWENISKQLNNSILAQINTVSDKIESGSYDIDTVNSLKNEFKDRSDDNHDIMHNIKEFLCEAFCLIEIVEEINDANTSNLMVSSTKFKTNIGQNKSYYSHWSSRNTRNWSQCFQLRYSIQIYNWLRDLYFSNHRKKCALRKISGGCRKNNWKCGSAKFKR